MRCDSDLINLYKACVLEYVTEQNYSAWRKHFLWEREAASAADATWGCDGAYLFV